MGKTGRSSGDLSRYLHQPEAAEVWVAPTREMLWWTRNLGSVIAPAPGRETRVSELVRLVTVTPSAHLSNLSLHFQSFLYDVFHQTTISRIAHFVCMPLVNMMLLAFVAQFSVWGVNVGQLAATALCVWYLTQAAYNRVFLLGLVMLPITVATWLGASAWYTAFARPEHQATWWAPTRLEHNPLLWAGLLSLVQAASHGPEPKLPPRVTGTPHWMPLFEFVFGPTGRRHRPLEVINRLIRSALQILFGALDEFWACWRLIPLNFLEILWALGYQPDMRAHYKDLSRRAIAHGDPAIDFIGVGGGAVIRDPDRG